MRHLLLPSPRQLRPFHVGALAALLALLNLTLRWPGELNPDSTGQLRQAIAGEWSDWHPPIMAVIWRWLLHFGSGAAPMLVLQVTLHWLGLGVLALVLLRRGCPRAALLMLAGGLTPMALKYTGVIQKDSVLASFLIGGFGLACLDNARARAAGVLVGSLGILARANGVFAAPALFFLALRRKWALPTTMLYATAFALCLIPVSQWINHGILGAERTGVERSLQLYDLAGIAYYSGDTSVLPVPIPNLARCYLPLYWDPLASARCGSPFHLLKAGIGKEWLSGIAKHPIAYLRHRLAHYNRTIFLLVPPAQQCADAPEAHDCPQSLWSDAIKKNGLLWPAAWLALGTVMLLSGLADIPRALCLSALFYGFGYLAVGVATDFRYFYWTQLAIQTALIFHVATAGFAQWRIALGAVLIVWLLGYGWRLAAVT